MTYGTQLNNAIAVMERRLAAGWDFADACFHAASKLNIKYEDLADYYDELHSDEYQATNHNNDYQ